VFLYHGAVVGRRWPGHAAEGAALINGGESPTSGAHTHVHVQAHPCPWVLGGYGFDIIVHGWAWVRIVFRWVWMGIAFKWIHNSCPSILLDTWTRTCMSCQYIEFSNSCLLYVLSLQSMY
jgi:hypothetical protein